MAIWVVQSWQKLLEQLLVGITKVNFSCMSPKLVRTYHISICSRKPENYNGTIIFEIDIMKKSSPINLNCCQTWLFHKYFGCFFCFDLLWSWAETAVSPTEKKCYFGFDSCKNVNFKLSGDEFFMMSISEIKVPL